jgi:hypothetical protein
LNLASDIERPMGSLLLIPLKFVGLIVTLMTCISGEAHSFIHSFSLPPLFLLSFFFHSKAPPAGAVGSKM